MVKRWDNKWKEGICKGNEKTWEYQASKISFSAGKLLGPSGARETDCIKLYQWAVSGHASSCIQTMSLHERLKVAVEVARSLNYLYNEKAILHGNLKSANILLETHNRNPLLTDYSLHRILTAAGTAEQVLNAGALLLSAP